MKKQIARLLKHLAFKLDPIQPMDWTKEFKVESQSLKASKIERQGGEVSKRVRERKVHYKMLKTYISGGGTAFMDVPYPLCGQGIGTSYGLEYTENPKDVTCKRCKAALKKQRLLED